jgi:TolA-binding protein
MRRVQILLVLALAAALAGPLAAQTARPSGALAEGIDHYQAGRYDQALISFRGIVLAQTDDPQKPAAYFWLSKTNLAAGRIDDAARNLEYYLASWPNAADRAEAVYLQGRVLHQQEEFEAAIQIFRSFLAEYPASPFAANAWFWSAESLYGLGRLEEASVIYQKVIREYPTSAKVEAAQYKASLIGLKLREQELSRLLKWSHEEFLRTMEEYQHRQESSDQAIEALQKRLAGGSAGATSATTASSTTAPDKAFDELRAELERKNAEASALAARISELEGQLAAANEAVAEAMMTDAAASAAGTAETERLLAAKAEALALKELLLGWLEGKGAQP